jgi:hypothetical protein
MAEALVKLSEDETRRAVAVAVAACLTPEVMSAALAHVLDDMMKPSQFDYPNKRSKVVQLFEEAICKRAAGVIDSMIDADENFQVEISRLLGDAVRKVFAEGEARNRVVEAMAAAFARKLSGS